MKESRTGPWTTALALLVFLASGAGAQPDRMPRFEDLDRDGDGTVSRQEASSRHGLRELIADYDENGDGRLDRREFQKLVDDAARETEQVITAGD